MPAKINKETANIIKKENSIGHQSEWMEYFECQICKEAEINEDCKYCPTCGVEIVWEVE